MLSLIPHLNLMINGCVLMTYYGILLTDIDRSYVGRIERGEVNITVEKLYQIANVLKCSPSELLP